MLLKSKRTNILINITLVLIIVFLLSKMGFIYTPIMGIARILLLPLVISLFSYYALRPVLRFFQRFKINKSLLILLILMLFALLLSVLIIYGGAMIKRQFQGSFNFNLDAITNINSPLGRMAKDIFENLQITQESFNILNNTLQKFTGNIGVLFSRVGNIGTQIILVPFILFYILKDDKNFVEGFMDVIPLRYKNIVRDALCRIDEVLSTYISGQLLVALVIGVLMFIGYLIIGMPNALVMAFFAMATSIIPLLGPFLGIIPALLIALTIDLSLVVKVLVTAVIVQQIEGNLITPNIIGNKLKVHPLSVILIIIISVSLFGFIGAFIGLPLYVVLKIVFRMAYRIYAERNRDVSEV